MHWSPCNASPRIGAFHRFYNFTREEADIAGRAAAQINAPVWFDGPDYGATRQDWVGMWGVFGVDLSDFWRAYHRFMATQDDDPRPARPLTYREPTGTPRLSEARASDCDDAGEEI